MTPFIWALLILLVALALIVMEVFIPSGGVLSFLAAIAVVVSIFLAFYNGGPVTGTIFLVFTAVLVPLAVYTPIRVWPNTPLGKLILIQPPESDEQVLPDKSEWKELIGRRGRAISKMLPSGAISIDHRTYDAVSEGMSIVAGTVVQVLAVEGNHIIVRPVDEEIAGTGEAALDKSGEDLLSQPMDSVIPDPFDDG